MSKEKTIKKCKYCLSPGHFLKTCAEFDEQIQARVKNWKKSVLLVLSFIEFHDLYAGNLVRYKKPNGEECASVIKEISFSLEERNLNTTATIRLENGTAIGANSFSYYKAKISKIENREEHESSTKKKIESFIDTNQFKVKKILKEKYTSVFAEKYDI